jgi:TolB protein
LNVRRVSFDSSYCDSPAWSPDGSKLAYAARYDGRFDVVVLDMASGKVERLTRGQGNNENPRWSPDGRHLVFSSSRAGSYDIYTMQEDGSNVRRHTKGGDAFMPDWR